METDISTGLVMNRRCSSTLHPLPLLPAMEVSTTVSIKGANEKLVRNSVPKMEASYMRNVPLMYFCFGEAKRKKGLAFSSYSSFLLFTTLVYVKILFLSSHKQNKFKLSLSACVDHRPAVHFLDLSPLCQNIDNGPVHCH